MQAQPSSFNFRSLNARDADSVPPSLPDRVQRPNGSNYSADNRPTNAAVKSRILIVGMDRMSADLLASALNQSPSFDAAAVSPEKFPEALASRKAQIAVISDELGDRRSGFDLASTILRAYPDLLIVILLSKRSRGAVINSFRAGARGIFSRDRPIHEFLDCIDHVRRGFLWAGQQEADVLLHVLKSLPAPNIAMASDATPLTDRELQVVQCAATGKTNRAIAKELHLSENTVKNYLFRAFEKLGVSSRVELLFYLTLRGHRFGVQGGGSKDGPAGDA
jgi:two-component system nitrate/nitrite response regulator NarL